jgi:hypothetical protein
MAHLMPCPSKLSMFGEIDSGSATGLVQHTHATGTGSISGHFSRQVSEWEGRLLRKVLIWFIRVLGALFLAVFLFAGARYRLERLPRMAGFASGKQPAKPRSGLRAHFSLPIR